MDENYNNQNNDYSNNQNPYNPQPQDNNQDTYNQQQGYYQDSYNQPQNGYQNNYNYNQQQGYQNGYNQPQQYYQEPADNSKGFAIASLVLGILGIASFLCCGTVCSILGLIFGIISRKKNPVNNSMATAGIVLSIIALVLGIIFFIWSLVAYGSIVGVIEEAYRNGDITYNFSY